ncbi:MAG TPA: succinate dehydrogenase, cytochrome b556 subunit [Terriglobia bacterium]|nr:succinate dehydrogenase, cytochrome b556 subunit [Terriglobia bacterium]
MSVKASEYLTYRGKGGQWSWMLHRATGLGVLLFLLIHIVDIALIGYGPKVFNALLFIYRAPVFRLSEVVLVAAVVYHALNGVRIFIIDFWPGTCAYHRKMMVMVAVMFVVIFVPAAIYMLRWTVR